MKKRLSFLFLIILIVTFGFQGCNLVYSSKTNTSDVNPNKMIVHYIDVSQGDSIFIQVNNKTLLIDSGPSSAKNKLLDYLRSLNISKIDYVIATHPHEDHIGNMAAIIKKYNVSKFYAPKVESSTKTFESMVEALKSKKLKINVIKKGIDSIDLGDNTRFTVLSPFKESYDNLNNYSPIIKIEYGNTSFLFTGDAEKEIENEILLNNEDIKSDVLKVGHHGSSTSTSDEFLRAINPSIAIISVGEDNTYDHPTNSTLLRLKENKVKVYRTDQESSLIFSSDGYNISKQ